MRPAITSTYISAESWSLCEFLYFGLIFCFALFLMYLLTFEISEYIAVCDLGVIFFSGTSGELCYIAIYFTTAWLTVELMNILSFHQ